MKKGELLLTLTSKNSQTSKIKKLTEKNHNPLIYTLENLVKPMKPIHSKHLAKGECCLEIVCIRSSKGFSLGQKT